jgi:hypothetical protein
MLLPRNGRIAVIDDEIGEALPLLRSLSRSGFASMYFSGEKKDLPENPLTDLRLVFLDMDLGIGGYTGKDDKSKSAATAKVFKSVVDTSKPCTCLVAIWSKHQELIEQFWKYVDVAPETTFVQVTLDKATCMTHNYDISLICEEIENSIKEKATFRFFTNWENVVHESSNTIVREFAESIPNGFGLAEELALATLRELAIAHAGKNLNEKDETDVALNAMLAFSGPFRDSLENCINSSEVPTIPFGRVQGYAVPQETIARINSKLLTSASSELRPGNMYVLKKNDLRKSIVFEIIDQGAWAEEVVRHNNVPVGKIYQGHRVSKEYAKEFAAFRKGLGAKSLLVYCETSPCCDYSQGKWEGCRLVYGVLVPGEHVNVVSRAPFLFTSPLFELGGQTYAAVFNMRRLITKTQKQMERMKPVCCMRSDLLIDLQHKIGSHCSRPGFVSLR